MLRLTELFSEKFLKNLIRNSDNGSDIEDALKRLDRLTQDEVQMAAAQLLKVTNNIDNRVEEIRDNMLGVDNRVASVGGQVQGVGDQVDRMERSWFPNCIHTGHVGSIILTGSQIRQDLRRWLSPPDPSTNHNIACNAHHKGTANWFFEGSTYKEWKSTGSDSLLWIHGKRVPVPFCRLTPYHNIPYL